MLAYPWVETEQARQMDVWDLMKYLAKQPKWSLAVVTDDRRADMAREKQLVDRLQIIKRTTKGFVNFSPVMNG